MEQREAKSMDDNELNHTKGYMTIEEIAAGTKRSSGTIRNLIKKLKIPKVVLPGDRRERVSPGNVEKIKKEITRRSAQ
jgi:hypothetical protein